MASPLKDKTVLVTGAASGIGRKLAHDLYWDEKCRLILVDIDAEALEVLKNELEPEGEGDRVAAFVCDIGSSESVARLARDAGTGPLDVLVNNAGVARLGSFEKTDFSEFERVVRVNLLGTARVTKAFLPRLLEAKNAFIVNVASMAGLVSAPGMSAYVASKFGVVGFSEALHAELGSRVGVGVVCPTFVRTNIAKGAAGKADSFLGAVGSKPAKVSAAVIGAIKHRKHLVLVNADAYLIYYLNRFFPGLSETVVKAGYRMLVATGVVEE
ncbi:MAG: short-chain dehydrogenase/reductase SDR [Elusimicrobia bacterium]|nr:MAG: short-chain dehydrogenase/reductase SDR [Elusimicrobiota bacterium]